MQMELFVNIAVWASFLEPGGRPLFRMACARNYQDGVLQKAITCDKRCVRGQLSRPDDAKAITGDKKECFALALSHRFKISAAA